MDDAPHPWDIRSLALLAELRRARLLQKENGWRGDGPNGSAHGHERVMVGLNSRYILHAARSTTRSAATHEEKLR